MSKVTIKGTVHSLDTKTGNSEKGDWKRTTLVVRTQSQYNNTVPVAFFNKDVPVNVGDSVEVTAYVAGREYKGNYYAQIDGAEVSSVGSQPQQQQQPQNVVHEMVEEDESDSLPF